MPGRERQMQVGNLRGRSASRIERDDLHVRALVARRKDALQDDGMTPGRVRTDQHDEIGSIEVFVTHRDDVFAKCALVPGYRRRHAEPRVGVDIGAAHVALHELVGDVIVFGQQLARHIERHGFRAMLADAVAECVGDSRDGGVPGRAFTAHLRVQQPIFEPDRLAECGAFDAELAAIGGMRRVSANGYRPALGGRREHTAADATVGAGSSSGRAGGHKRALGRRRRIEQQLVPYRSDVGLVSDQVAQARGFAHVAEQHGAAHVLPSRTTRL